MRTTLLTAAGELVAAVLIWLLGVRYGFRRGFSARMAGGIPPQIARSRQLTKAFGKGLAQQARKAHLNEIDQLKRLRNAPTWRQRIHRLLFPVLVAAIASSSSSCGALDALGPNPPVKPCLTDTTFWIPRVAPIGRIVDSLLVTVTLNTCAGGR